MAASRQQQARLGVGDLEKTTKLAPSRGVYYSRLS